MLAEFQSRKAQRILLRDRDMLKYLIILVVVVVAYMVTWTVVSLDHVTADSPSHLVVTRHVTASNVALAYCKLGWWHYVIEIGSSVVTIVLPLADIKYSLDFLRPITTAETFGAVDWLADLPPTKMDASRPVE